MRDFLKIDAAQVVAQIARIRTVYPELNDDLELLSSAVEGETDFERVIERVVDAFMDAVSMKGAIADRMSALQERGQRFDTKAEALKGMAYELMRAADQTLVRLPEATLSVRKGHNSVVVDDVSQLPQGFTKTERLALKSEIKRALEHGDAVPGAHLETGPEGLTIRTK